MLSSQTYILPSSPDSNDPGGGPGYPFYVTAKRYWNAKQLDDTLNLEDLDNLASRSHGYHDGGIGEGNGDNRPKHHSLRLTLIVLHSTSFHKEIWEPTLDTLFNISSTAPTSPTSGAGKRWTRRANIREAWSIECPNHGESATLNDHILQSPEYANNFSCDHYAHAVHRFLTSGPVNFKNRNLVGIGHSLGANTILLLQNLQPVLKFRSLIIIEPMLSPEGSDKLASLRSHLVKTAQKRRDVWDSREDAFGYLKSKDKSRGGPGKWDERVLQVFVKYALRQCVSRYTLSCTRPQEVAMYLDELGSTEPVKILNHICSLLPVHLIVGTIHDFIPASVQQALFNPGAGRVYASVIRVPNTGHLIPQEMPDVLASLIHVTLSSVSVTESSTGTSHLAHAKL